MSAKMEKALEQLNAASGVGTYTVRQEGDALYLQIPSGWEYPPVSKSGMVERLVSLQIAATGRAK